VKHLSEEVVILVYYGEPVDEAVKKHLAACPDCREEVRKVAAVLNALQDYTVPEPQPAFEQLLWQRIAPAIRPRVAQPRLWHYWWQYRWQRWVLAPGLVCLLIGSFFVGRLSMSRSINRPVTVPSTLAGIMSDSGRERILLVALGDHLERSQMVLVEIANGKPGSAAEFQLTQQRAQNLVGENRLYRQAAQLSGDTEFSDLLDELERVLTDIANRPSDLSSPELEQIQHRIESRGLIFKIRVTGSNLQQKGSEKL
jgi:hypothetical protein